MRRRLVESDLLECVLGLGPNLFYNSPMEACVVVCRAQKPPARRGRVLFIDAVNEVVRERAQSFLTPSNQARILATYRDFADKPGFAAVASTGEILSQQGSLAIPRYVHRATSTRSGEHADLRGAWEAFEENSHEFWPQMDDLLMSLEAGVAEEETPDA
jgi:type I restriction enzyme M protein